MKKIAILGSTGSVGSQALEVAEHLGCQVLGLTAATDTGKAEEQIRRFRPALCAMADEKAAKSLAVAVADTDTKVIGGDEAVAEVAAMADVDTVVHAVGGVAGLAPTLAAIDAGKTLALSNKESLVTAGDIVMKRAAEKGVRILPVDSEHSAIFQCLCGNSDDNGGRTDLVPHLKERISSLILTASGGPFWGRSREELSRITVEEALDHPTWKMGKKITVDSATLMNKGLEIIEAAHLFGLDADRIKVTVHRESIIHSMVSYKDGAVIAQMGAPDMRTCIQYALTYPDRAVGLCELVDFAKISKLTFYEPDADTFYLLNTAYTALRRGGNIPAAMNAANEVAVELFLRRKIAFTDIFALVTEIAETFEAVAEPSLEDILLTDRDARAAAVTVYEQKYRKL